MKRSEKLIKTIHPNSLLIGPKRVIDCPNGFVVYNKKSIIRFKYTNKKNTRFKKLNHYRFPDDKPDISAVFYVSEVNCFFVHLVRNNQWLNDDLSKTNFSIKDDLEHALSTSPQYAIDLASTSRNRKVVQFNPYYKHASIRNFFHPPEFKYDYFELGYKCVYHFKYDDDGQRTNEMFLGNCKVPITGSLVSVEKDFYTYVNSFSFHVCRYNSNGYSYQFNSFITASHRLNINKLDFVIVTDSHEIYHLRLTECYSSFIVEKLIEKPVSIYIDFISETQNELFFSSENTGLLIYHKHSKTLSYLLSEDQLRDEVNIGLKVSHKLYLPCNSWINVTNDGKNSVISKHSLSFKITKTTLSDYEFYKKMISKMPRNPSDTLNTASITYSNKKLSITLANKEKPIFLKVKVDYIPTGIKIFDCEYNSLKFAMFDKHNVTTCEPRYKFYNTKRWESSDYIIDVELAGDISEDTLYILTISGNIHKFNLKTNESDCIQLLSGATQIVRIDKMYFISKSQEVMTLNFDKDSTNRPIYYFTSPITEIDKLNSKYLVVKTINDLYLIKFEGDKILHELPIKSTVTHCILFNNFIIATTSKKLYLINTSNLKIQLIMDINPDLSLDVDTEMNLIFLHRNETYIYEYTEVDNTLKLEYHQRNGKIRKKLGLDTYRKKKIIGGICSNYFEKAGYKVVPTDTIQIFKTMKHNGILYYIYIDDNNILRVCKVEEVRRLNSFNVLAQVSSVNFMDIHAERYVFYFQDSKAYIFDVATLKTATVGCFKEIENVLFLNHKMIDWNSQRLLAGEIICDSTNKGILVNYFVKKIDRTKNKF